MQLEHLPLNAEIVIPKHTVARVWIDWLGYWVQYEDGQNWHAWRQFPAGYLANVAALPMHLQERGRALLTA